MFIKICSCCVHIRVTWGRQPKRPNLTFLSVHDVRAAMHTVFVHAAMHTTSLWKLKKKVALEENQYFCVAVHGKIFILSDIM